MILILDDSFAQRDTIKDILVEEGYNEEELILTKDAKSALKAAEDHKTSIQLAIVDICLDERDTNNYEGVLVASKLRNRNIPTVLLTNFDNSDNVKRANEAGIPISRFISKRLIEDNRERFFLLLSEAKQEIPSKSKLTVFQNHKIGIKRDGTTQIITFYTEDDIIYLQSEGVGFCRLYFNDGSSFLFSANQGHISKQIRDVFPNFVVLKNNISVNITKIISLDRYNLFLKSDKKTYRLEIGPVGKLNLGDIYPYIVSHR